MLGRGHLFRFDRTVVRCRVPLSMKTLLRIAPLLLTLALLLAPVSVFAARLQTIVPLPAGTIVTALKFDPAGNIYLGGYSKPASPKST